MATTKSQQELARKIAEQMRREGYESWSDTRFNQILGHALKELQGESWRIQRRAIAPLTKKRLLRGFAANDPRTKREERKLLAEHHEELVQEDNALYWQRQSEECNYTTHPID